MDPFANDPSRARGPRRILNPAPRVPSLRTPKVLVLVACRNGAAWIGQQVESILTQDDVDLRVVVRDDGSSDNTLGEIARFQDDARMTLSAGCDSTNSAAQNFLALIRDNPADGLDFIAFADQDDIWFRHKLARACRMLINSRLACGYSSSTLAMWPNGRTMPLTHSVRFTPTDFLFEGAGQGCTYVLRADFYADLRAFLISHWRLTERIHYHDWMVYALARAWGNSWLLDPSPSMCYRQHENNDTGARCTWAGVLMRFRRIRQGWYRDQLIAIGSICAAAAPTDATIKQWMSLFLAQSDWHRRVRVALFCLRGARRRRSDNLAIAAAALAGWI